MLQELLDTLHNWFVASAERDTYTIKDGVLVLPFLQDGQYFKIKESVFNDGLYCYPANGLTDETFTGTVYALKIPPAVIELAAEIEQWQKDNPVTYYASESFGGYSYSAAMANGKPITWQDHFRERMKRWRKIC